MDEDEVAPGLVDWRQHRRLVQSKRLDRRFVYHLDLAVELHAFGALRRAAWHVRHALACKPNEPDALATKGRIQEARGHFEEALATFRFALDRSSESFHLMHEEFLVALTSSAARCCILLGLDAATGAQRAVWHQRASAWLDLVPGESQGILREVLQEDRLLRPLMAGRSAVRAIVEVQR